MNYGGRCRIFFKFWGNKAPNNFYPPLFFCCRQWRGASGLLLLERWSPQTRLKGTAEIRLLFSHHWFMGFLLDDRHRLPLLTKLHADILVWILLPQFLITVCVTHEGEHHILNDALKNKKEITIRDEGIDFDILCLSSVGWCYSQDLPYTLF